MSSPHFRKISLNDSKFICKKKKKFAVIRKYFWQEFRENEREDTSPILPDLLVSVSVLSLGSDFFLPFFIKAIFQRIIGIRKGFFYLQLTEVRDFLTLVWFIALL